MVGCGAVLDKKRAPSKEGAKASIEIEGAWEKILYHEKLPKPRSVTPVPTLSFHYVLINGIMRHPIHDSRHQSELSPRFGFGF